MKKKQIVKQVIEALNPPNFSDLKFEDHPGITSAQQSKIFFDNGYGASVIHGSMLNFSDPQRHELAVLKGNEEEWHLCYSTPITSDVIPYCTSAEITQLLREIKNLP